jgi:DnaJ like chaperone protein
MQIVLVFFANFLYNAAYFFYTSKCRGDMQPKAQQAVRANIGKISGGIMGYTLLNIPGAVVGAALGKVLFDDRQNTGKTRQQGGTMQLIADIARLAAKVAKADGVINKNEVAAFKKGVIIPDNARQQVAAAFNEARDSGETMGDIAGRIYSNYSKSAAALEGIVRMLIDIARADGKINLQETFALHTIAGKFHIHDQKLQQILTATVTPERVTKAADNEFIRSKASDYRRDPPPVRTANEVFYRRLGLRPGASIMQVKAAWTELSKKFHPDMNKGTDAVRRMAEINQAYEEIKKSARFL